jgi:prepilin-type N-terminal cleavage/methylation domain-containing protein/prepilin-type processing-associated H-X9-DG protein
MKRIVVVRAFTLTEMLVVIAIITILTAVLFPVFAAAREKARQTACISNEMQLGLAILQYTQDYDELFPWGYTFSDGSSGGAGWGGLVYPYTKSLKVYACPDDNFNVKNTADSQVSYAYNVELPQNPVQRLTSPDKTVLLCEVSHIEAELTVSNGFDQSPWTGQYSPSTEGICLYGAGPSVANGVPTGVDFATGYMGGRGEFTGCGPNYNRFLTAAGRHSTGSNFLSADGHAKWLIGNDVSSGQEPTGPTCDQGSVGAGCIPNSLAAAGTSISKYALTFSPQ